MICILLLAIDVSIVAWFVWSCARHHQKMQAFRRAYRDNRLTEWAEKWNRTP